MELFFLIYAIKIRKIFKTIKKSITRYHTGLITIKELKNQTEMMNKIFYIESNAILWVNLTSLNNNLSIDGVTFYVENSIDYFSMIFQ